MSAALALSEPRVAEAKRIFEQNCDALGITARFRDLDFQAARDGALTAKIDGQWLGGCSVPRRAAERMAGLVEARGKVICLLLPSQPYQVAAMLDHLDSTQALIVLLDAIEQLPIFLSCCDFTTAGRAHRLFFCDRDTLAALFDTWPGLSPAEQLVRLPDAPADRIEAAIKESQHAFGLVVAKSTARIQAARAQYGANANRPLIIASARFELWADEGFALAGAIEADSIDTSDPAGNSLAWLAEQAARHSAIITPNIGRADRTDIAHADQPWLTWVTGTSVPAFVPTSPRDGLLLASELLLPLARAAGWPADRCVLTGWPTLELPVPRSGELVMIYDLPDLTSPKEVNEYSSWRVVWEAVREELSKNPFALGSDPKHYLARALVRLQLPSANFPEAVFSNVLLPAAVAVGTAHWCKTQNIPLRIHGRGWASAGVGEIDPIETREAFHAALAAAAGLIDPFITHPVHAIRSIGRPVLNVVGVTPQRLAINARAIIGGAGAVAKPSLPPLSKTFIDALLAS